jgi:FkbM family methyltransferase
MKTHLARLANHLYDHAPAVYRSLYSAYKRLADREERALLEKVIGPGMVVLDIGANIGTYAKFLAKLAGPTGRVIAFEPEPRNFALLERAVAHLPQVTAMHAAVAERGGTLDLYVADDLNVDHHSYDDGEGRRRVAVPALALDDLFKPGERVDFIKMDIQGAEMSALLGAERILAENRKIELLLEYWPFGLRRANVEPAQLLETLAQFDFTVEVVGRSGGRPEMIGSGPDDYCNLHARRISNEPPK